MTTDAVTLSHWSAKPIEQLRVVPQESVAFKPKGLWVSVDGEDDWLSWCTGEGYGGIHEHRYRVHADLDALLWLKTGVDVRAFKDRYAQPVPMGDGIDWRAVARDFPGMLIAPYQWDVRLEMTWYYGWDCASGCIWNPEAAGVRLVRN